MKTRNLLMGAALALIAPLTILNVGCGDEPTPADTDAGQIATDAGSTEGDDAGTNGGNDAGTETDAGTQPNGESKIWFYGDYKTDNKYAVARHDLPAGETTDLAFDDLGSGRVNQWDVSSDGKKVLMLAARVQAGRQDLVTMNADGTGLTNLVEMPGTGPQDMTDARFSPDGTKILFRADYAEDGVNDVYVVPTSGGTPVRITPDRPSSGDPKALGASAMAWSPTGKYVAIVGDYTTDRALELYIADISGAAPTVVTALPASEIGDVSGETASFGVASQLAWSNDDLVVFKVRKVGSAAYNLYSVKPDGSGLQKVAQAPADTVDIGGIAVSPDGKTLAYSADAITANADEVYVLPLDGSAAPKLISSGTVAAGRSILFNSLTWSPDGTRLAFAADYDATAEGHFDLYVAPADGTAIRLVAVGDSADKDVDVTDGIAWAPDSSGIAFAADHLVKDDTDIFRTTDLTTPNQTPITVQKFVSGGDAHDDVYWTP